MWNGDVGKMVEARVARVARVVGWCMGVVLRNL